MISFVFKFAKRLDPSRFCRIYRGWPLYIFRTSSQI